MTLLRADETIETQRLLLRRITRDDQPFFERIHAIPDVARYLAHGRPRTAEESSQWMDTLLAAYAELQMGQIAITRKSDGALVGRCGVSHLETEVEPQPDGSFVGYYFPAHAPPGRAHVTQQELGYTLDTAHWGNGYAREAVGATWQYLQAHRPGMDVVSLIHPDNARSIRLATGFGAARVDRIVSWDRPFDRYVWPAGKSPSIDR